MKRTITLRSAVACALLLLAACTKNDDTQTTAPENNGGGDKKTRLVAVHTDELSSFDTLTYTDGKLNRYASIDPAVSSVPFYEERYTYGANNMVSQAARYFDNVFDMKDSIVYVSAKKLVMYSSFDNGTTTISLDDNGQLQEATVQNESVTWKLEYTYTNKNLTGLFSTRTDGDGSVTNTEYIIRYDNKINPAYEIARNNFRLRPVWKSLVLFNLGSTKDLAGNNMIDSYNNPSSIKFLQYQDGVFKLDVNIDYTYEYDDAGYPVKQTAVAKALVISGSGNGNNVEDEQVHRFTYGK